MPLQIRRGTNAQRQAMTVPLAPGEPLYTTDQGFLYIGNGSALGGVQVTGYQDENAVDAVGSALTSGIHQNIVFIYNDFPQDVSNRIDAYIDLSYYDGEISAPAFRGSVLDDGSSTLINASNGSINLDGTVKGDIVPDANETYDIGSNSNRFRDLYLSGSSLFLGTAQITAAGSIVDLPVGSTVGGLPISALEGIIPGSNYNANIIADDSSVMVDTSAQQIFAANGFIGNVTGNLTGNLTGYQTGDMTGSVFSDNSTLLVDGTNAVLRGTHIGDVIGNIVGNVLGDLVGSVFGDDSTIIIDGNNNIVRTTNLTFAGTNISSNTNEVRIGSDTDDQQVIMYSGERNFFELYGTYDTISTLGPWIELRVSEGTMDFPSATNDQSLLSGLLCYGHDGTDYIQAGVLAFKVSGTTSAGAVPAELFVLCESDTIGSPSVLSFTGNQGILTAPTIQPGVYTDAAARDAFLTSPAAGMMIFNTALQKFQGYVSDTGIAGGGAPNLTPGWINLN